MIPLGPLDPQPAGFPGCMSCPYRTTGTPAVCFTCANGGAATVPTAACPVCGQELGDDDRCPNTVCTLDDRWFSRVLTACERPEEMWAAVWQYKYDQDRAWAPILGRILVGFLEQNRADLARYDLITAGALYVGPRARRLWDTLRLILDGAQAAGPDWPFVPDLITKSGPTGQFLGRSVATRRAIAEHSLRPALAVPRPDLVAGRRILVLDDVYSEGFTLREMARVLMDAGAAEVAGLVLARRKGG
ncbi:ComF family protein [Geodermatophilus sabuli]|uniref:ComF family protein n=1 Tax=Geodermatophilus sabuli TaxID=1564158 RepID=A0A7K3VXC7_9ACTN|nr:ComF family protein [Geodermatophilus sabuli]NEK56723.1 ComF family protein [Geodermatophilus sabuli]